jgi:hypothetical protein
MSNKSDLIHVVDRTALIENILNQVIEAFCEPRRDPYLFFWNVVLDSSIMPLGSKVKIASAIAQELDIKIEQDALHKVMSLRNAFAHHKTGSHPIVAVGNSDADSEMHFQLQVLSNSGKLSRKRREDALAEFDEAFRLAKDSLVGVLDIIKAKRAAQNG